MKMMVVDGAWGFESKNLALVDHTQESENWESLDPLKAYKAGGDGHLENF